MDAETEEKIRDQKVYASVSRHSGKLTQWP